ncbi:molecular chaperone HscB [Filimonas lacunae]|uniref:Molecular chaperone HscB n=1 Tax=Filimonas lacunae TaxID=477680 RepID=A0A173MA60_9BACT|nr:DnaJ domain-containing protein [Filimonas lacunae]BAV04399.1 chaperone protein HscB [Filimonas lacunae]SIT31294.1 molecular chaperone HscB [Filimonas lacunae]
MNYFELFSIPVSLQPDMQQVKKKFYELSRQYHPDFYAQATAVKQNEALEKAAAVNKAYKVLQNRDETIKYLLATKGLLEEEEKYQLPPDFLMEMLDLNEMATDAAMEQNAAKTAQVKTQIANVETEIYEPVEAIITNYQEGVTTEKELLQVKDYYYKKKYLTRILVGLK